MSSTKYARATVLVCIAAVLAAAGCATRPAPDFRGRWKPVNAFAEAPIEIPLASAYVFQATPLDGTLKTMLERWAKDAKMTLAYEHPSDFTLYGAVADIRTGNLQDAIARLNAAYAMQRVAIRADGGRIVVRTADVSAAAPATP